LTGSGWNRIFAAQSLTKGTAHISGPTQSTVLPEKKTNVRNAVAMPFCKYNPLIVASFRSTAWRQEQAAKAMTNFP
jgi:hypothetical protein